ncbi:type 2 lanthipeptide synthetase LanM family protein [Bacillus licheniformis]|uniref:type 2 lanthipeptide synthetase LanM family protein n=1 Tax=Bacillus licheniformis TaxID=1402 RepID=UPI00237CDE84|nr:type 2 lanthipeptide synthetase LanM family protein [Bacillus licheniformis]MDE1458183.1 type 2 lanthipeptide synthetase LanM family protein [Bacillus licheniformis]
MNEKSAGYHERLPVAQTQSPLVNDKIKYWRSLFGDDDKWLNKAVSLLSHDPLSSIAQSSVSQSVGLKDSRRGPWQKMQKRIFETPFSYKDSALQDSELLFDSLLTRFASAAQDALEEQNIILSPPLCRQVLTHLKQTLLQIAHQTLILELNILRLEDQLKGDTPEMRYLDFNDNFLVNPGYLRTLFNEYPVLLRLLCTKTDYWVQNFSELWKRLRQDREQLQAAFHIAGDPVHIELGVGDSHNKGKMAAILTYSDGKKIVYKPRSHDVDDAFQLLLSWINDRNSGSPLKTLRLINKKRYGWSEFIPHETCHTKKELEGYYTRLGKLLAVLYSIDAVDFHHENIIASGEHPVLIDLESIFHQYKKRDEPGSTAVDKANYILSRSVRSTGILPFNLYFGRKNRDKVVDISGMGGQEAQESPFQALQIKGFFRDDIRLEHDRFEIGEAKNLPTLDHQHVPVADYLHCIIEGFSAVYRLISDHGESYLATIEHFKNCTVRNILKPTAHYASLLNKSYHPDFLRDAVDREVFLCRVEKFEDADTDIAAAKTELKELIRGDIPYFLSKPSNTYLLNGEEEPIAAYFETPSFTRVIKKISSFSDQDLKEQANVIRMSILAAYNARHEKDAIDIDQNHPSPRSGALQPLAIAEKAADDLAEKRIEGNDGKDVTWISTVIEGVEEISWTISPVSLDLYNGNAGIGFFMSYLSRFAKRPETYSHITEQCVFAIQRALNELKEKEEFLKYADSGAFTGVSGYLYFLQHAGTVQKKNEWIELIHEALPVLEAVIEQDENCDIISGSAGALMVLMSLYEQLDDPVFLKLAEKCAGHLLQHKTNIENGAAWKDPHTQNYYTGFAHGTSGIAAALSRFNKVFDSQSLKKIISQCLAFEKQLYIASEKNWGSKGREQLSVAWCHGAAGILLSRSILRENGVNDPGLHTDILNALETTVKHGFGNNRSFCHGDFGQLEILRGFREEFSELNTIIQNTEDRLLTYFQENPFSKGVSRGVDSAGLMLGLSGVGYGMLQCQYGEELPELLQLSPPQALIKKNSKAFKRENVF